MLIVRKGPTSHLPLHDYRQQTPSRSHQQKSLAGFLHQRGSVAKQLLTSTHTTDISSNNDNIDALQLLTSTHTTDISSNDEDIIALQLLTESHTTEIISNDKDIAAYNTTF